MGARGQTEYIEKLKYSLHMKYTISEKSIALESNLNLINYVSILIFTKLLFDIMQWNIIYFKREVDLKWDFDWQFWVSFWYQNHLGKLISYYNEFISSSLS